MALFVNPGGAMDRSVYCLRGRSLLLRLFFLVLAWMAVGCSNSAPILTDAQMNKLDPALQRLVEGEPRGMDRYSTSERDDGTTVYGVILRSDDPASLQDAGLPVNSVQGDIVTARLTIDQIRRAARLDAVRRIENPTQTGPTP